MNYDRKSVCIILLNYNGYKDTIDCIKSLKKIYYKNYKIVVIDNDSTDGSYQYIKNEFRLDEDIVLIKSEKNIGFSGGNNIGIRWAIENNFEYICLLNNDTVVEADFLCHLVRGMESDKSIGISAGKIMYFNDKQTIWSAGGYINEIKSLGCHYGIDEKDSTIYDKEREVEFLTGCLQLIRKDVFNKIGFYEDKYFLYMEDVDFCWRAQKSGYKLKYIPKSKIYHKVSASTGGERSPIILYYMSRNRLLLNKLHQEKVYKKILFYIFYFIKMIIEPVRTGANYKYLVLGIKDYFANIYGQRILD